MGSKELTGKEMVPEDWSDGKPMTLDEYTHRQWESGLESGVKNGLAIAKERLMSKAHAAFDKGDDKTAALLRELAADIAKEPKRG